MDESGEHHPQQTDTRTENKTPDILTHTWVMKNEETWESRQTSFSNSWASYFLFCIYLINYYYYYYYFQGTCAGCAGLLHQ